MFPMQQTPVSSTPEEKFGASVSAMRAFRELSQRQFAEKLSKRGMTVDASAVSRIEKGTRSVRLVEAMTIAEVLDVELDRLIAGSESPAQEFRKMRRWADFALHELEEPLGRVMFLLYDALEHLRQHPDLLDALEDGEVGRPDGVEGYLDWVGTRLEKWTVSNDNFTLADESDAEAVVRVIARYAAMMIGPELPEPEGDEDGEHQEEG
jgi:transcriptional regulator with XRE-family HTH domain